MIVIVCASMLFQVLLKLKFYIESYTDSSHLGVSGKGISLVGGGGLGNVPKGRGTGTSVCARTSSEHGCI